MLRDNHYLTSSNPSYWAFPQRLDAQVTRQGIKLRDQCRQHRHAILHAIRAARTAFLPRQPDLMLARQRTRRAQIAQVTIHLGAECFQRREARNIKRDDEMAGVAGIRVIVVEIENLSPKSCAVERARQ